MESTRPLLFSTTTARISSDAKCDETNSGAICSRSCSGGAQEGRVDATAKRDKQKKSSPRDLCVQRARIGCSGV